MQIMLLAAPYLLGLLAVAIPVLLHLRPRTKQIVIRFSATRFLEPALRRTARRLRFQNLMLMAMRASLVALMALAFAMPMLRSLAAGALAFDAQTGVVLVLDASYSMGYRDHDLRRFDRATAAGAALLGALGERDQAALVLAGAEARIAPPGLTGRIDLVRQRLADARLTHGPCNLRQALITAGKLVEGSSQPANHVFVITDLQRHSFAGMTGQPVGPGLLNRASLTIIDVGRDRSPNTAVTDASVLTSRRSPAVPLTIEAKVRCFGVDERQTVASLLFGRKKTAQRALSLAPGAEAKARFTHTFYRAGGHAGTVELAPDSLDADNRRYLAVQIHAPAPVLCVDGDLSRVAERQETFFFRTAILPPGASGPADAAERDRARPVLCSPGELARQSLDSHRVVLLANVPDFTADAVAALERFTSDGGGLLVFLGDRVRPEAYNKRLWSADGGLLPVKLAGRIGRADRRQPLRLTAINFRHPLLARFRDRKLGDLERVHVYQAVGVQPETLAKDAAVLARYDDGSPAVVETSYGRGKVVLVTTSADSDWTNLPIQPVFVPLVHELVHYLSAETHEQQHYVVGETIRVPLDISAAGATVRVEGPDGKTAGARVRSEANRLVAEYAGAETPGHYTVTIRTGGRERRELAAVNMDPAESDLARMDEKALAGCFHPDQPYRLTDPDHLAEALAQGREGHKVWIWLLYLALIFFIVEALYAGRLSADAEPPRRTR